MPVTLTVDPDGVAHLTLDRAAKRNALDGAMLTDLRDRIAEIRSRSDVRIVVLRGAGGTFCAGADIADWVSPPHDVAAELSRLGQDTFAELATLPVTSVAVVEGTAVGGGLELALACDLRVAADDALLGLPELGLGNLPSWGGTARLVDIAGLGVTRHLLLSGELISGARAAELLVVTSAHPVADLAAAVHATVQRLLGAEPLAVSLAKKVLREFEHRIGLEATIAAYTAGLDSSRLRKQHFLDRKAAARAAKQGAAQAARPTEPTTVPSEGTTA
jgi:enoyl-CoA hydratase/carnithine racemase